MVRGRPRPHRPRPGHAERLPGREPRGTRPRRLTLVLVEPRNLQRGWASARALRFGQRPQVANPALARRSSSAPATREQLPIPGTICALDAPEVRIRSLPGPFGCGALRLRGLETGWKRGECASVRIVLTQWRRRELNPRPQPRLNGFYERSRASVSRLPVALPDRVLEGQPPEMSPDRRGRTSPGEPAD